MESAVVESYIDVENVAVFEWSVVGNAVTNDFVDAGTDGFWEVAVV